MPKAPQQHSLPSAACKHVATKRHNARTPRQSTHARGYNREWEAFSKAFLAANPRCEFCLAKGRVRASRVTDHDIPHRYDPHLFWNNTFTALCFTCHNSTKQRLEARYEGDELLQAIEQRKRPQAHSQASTEGRGWVNL